MFLRQILEIVVRALEARFRLLHPLHGSKPAFQHLRRQLAAQCVVDWHWTRATKASYSSTFASSHALPSSCWGHARVPTAKSALLQLQLATR